MSNVTCTFTVADTAIGGKLTGGFADGVNVLQANDNLIVIVNYPAGGATIPANLGGVFVFTPSPAASNQTTPSPFLNATSSNYVCLQSQVGTRSGPAGGYYTYTFPPVQYLGAQVGAYELTFVAIDGTRQWSEDPEFDTSS